MGNARRELNDRVGKRRVGVGGKAPNSGRSVRRRLLALEIVVVLMVPRAAVFACAPQPMLSVQPRASAAPGTQVTVEGTNFEGQVELRWNGLDGALLASSTGAFVVTIATPEAPDGLYALVALERKQDGSIGGVARTPFQVAWVNPITPTSPPRTTTFSDADQSSSKFFAVGWMISGAIVLLLTGAVLGARTTRRRRTISTPGDEGLAKQEVSGCERHGVARVKDDPRP